MLEDKINFKVLLCIYTLNSCILFLIVILVYPSITLYIFEFLALILFVVSFHSHFNSWWITSRSLRVARFFMNMSRSNLIYVIFGWWYWGLTSLLFVHFIDNVLCLFHSILGHLIIHCRKRCMIFRNFGFAHKWTKVIRFLTLFKL